MRRVALALSAALTCLALPCAAQDREAIRVGISTPLTGPNAAYGTGLVAGVRLGLAPLLSAGLAGRTVELVVLDDASDPARAAANTTALLQRGVTALTAYHGARSIEAVLPQLLSAGVPLVGAASSADSLRHPDLRFVFNLRAGAADELGALVLQYDTIGLQRFAAVVQDDALGTSGLDGLKHELTRIAIRLESSVLLPSSAGVKETTQAVVRLCAGAPEALLLAMDARLALAALRAARDSGCAKTRFAALSEAGLALAGQPDARGLLVAQVLPNPKRTSHPLVAAYQRALGADIASASYPSLEGYLYGHVLAETLRACGRQAGAACVQETLNHRPPELPGWRLRFTPQDRRGARFVEMTLLGSDGRVLH